MGETIKKVLIDGEEFFSDDYTLITKNFRSKMVDKVQVYNRRDNNRDQKEKVVDLKLKEDSKHGIFGRASGGMGSRYVYENQVMVNRFKNKMKMSTYGTFSNTRVASLGGRNRELYNEGTDERISYDIDLDSWNGEYNEFGLPENISGGGHFSNRWKEDKQYINLNYKISSLELAAEENTISQTELSNNTLNTEGEMHADNHRLKNQFNGIYEIKPDSSLFFRIGLSSTLNKKDVYNKFTSNQRDRTLDTINMGTRTIQSESDYKKFALKVEMEKTFKNKRRLLRLELGKSYIDQQSTGNLFSHYTFHNVSNEEADMNIAQYKANQSKSNYHRGKLIYTEPLSRTFELLFNYSAENDNSNARLQTFDVSSNIMQHEDATLSGSYKLNRITNRGGTSILFKKNKTNLIIGSDYINIDLKHNDVFNSKSNTRTYGNLYPNLEFIYAFSRQESFVINYFGDVVQPLISQTQPISNNLDPLNIINGNAELDPYYKNTIYLAYNNYIPQGPKHFFSNLTISQSNNAVSMNILIDEETGRSTFAYENVGSSFQYNSYIGTGKKIESWDAFLGLNLNFDGSRNNIILNSVKNMVKSNIYAMSIYSTKHFSERFIVDINTGAKLNVNSTTLQNNGTGNFWQYNAGGNIWVPLPMDVNFQVSVDYQSRQKNVYFNENINVLLINPSIERKFLKDKSLNLKLAANDVLNQNLGFTRFISSNTITQRTFSTLSRYYLLTLSWDFNKMKI